MMMEEWNIINRIILYGYGTVGRGCIRKILKDFDVDYIIDNNELKQGNLIGSVPIVSIEEGIEKRVDQKIIVMTGGRTYQEISEVLKKYNLNEYEDFCSIEELITDWYWLNKKENNIMELHMALTMKCTLACENCNMFIPYYKNPPYYDVEQIIEELELLFSKVDNVFCLTFLGGEPLLYKELPQLFSVIRDKYLDHIGSVKIVTNGTVLPDRDFLKQIKEMPVWFSISDYTNQVSYCEKLENIKQLLDEMGVDYVVNSAKKWCSFGFPKNPLNIDKQYCEAHMKACSPIFHGYNDGKIYYCHVSWSAEKLGRIVLKSSDYIDLKALKNEESHVISEHCFGRLRGSSYISFCEYCGGCGDDNKNVVLAGQQVKSIT